MALTRRHGISTNTYSRFLIDSGAVYFNYTTSGTTNLLGATRGGNTFTIDSEYRDMEADGARGPVKGGRRITNVTVTLVANMLEIDNTKVIGYGLTGSDTTDSGAYYTTTRSLEISAGDYLTDIAIVGEVSGSESDPAVFICKNPISTGGFEVSMSDKDETVIPITFTGHFTVAAMDTEPWEIRWPDFS